MLKTKITFIVIFAVLANLSAQEIKWKKKKTIQKDLHLFHATHVVNLPTAAAMQKGDFELVISHRFIPTIDSGFEDLFGLDGPVVNRLSLSYAAANKILITLGRSNQDNNYDLAVKYKFYGFRHKILPVLAAVRIGAAWNSRPADARIFNRSKNHHRNFQYFGQLIINTLYKNKLGIGLVPSYLYNTYIFSRKIKNTFTMGTYIQYYVSPKWSLFIEANPAVSGCYFDKSTKYNTISTGLELETGGHFFKVFLTNSAQINTSQYLAGTDLAINGADWRLGFNITRTF